MKGLRSPFLSEYKYPAATRIDRMTTVVSVIDGELIDGDEKREFKMGEHNGSI